MVPVQLHLDVHDGSAVLRENVGHHDLLVVRAAGADAASGEDCSDRPNQGSVR